MSKLFKNYLALTLPLMLALCICTSKTYGQDVPSELYIARNIPDSLKTDANAVVRYSKYDVEVKGPGKMVTSVHTIITILNEKGDGYGGFLINYNKKFSNLSSFEMLVYDADSKLLKKYHKSDMYDHAAFDDESLMTDDRILELGHTIASYPATVELIYEFDENSLIGLGSWEIQAQDQSVQNTYYNLSISKDAGFRYLNRNTLIKPQKTTVEGIDRYSWQGNNLKAVKMEDGALPWRVLPALRFTASKFEFYGLPGDISTWQNYGKWQQGLNADVCSLSAERLLEIKKMTDSIRTDKEKVKFLYRYMQQNMRYVSIQLGIGGLKPFPAAFVDQKKYGDCKALSNYMCALLKAVNITAYYAKVRAGSNEEPYDSTFPFDMSNHIIVCVPFKNDTTWLECTSSTQPFGTLGAFTENRNALIITEDGGKLVNTPKSTAAENQFNSEVHLVLNQDGSAKAKIKTFSTGEVRGMFVDELPRYKIDQQKEILIRFLDIKQPEAFDFKSETDIEGTKEFDMDLEYDKYCDIMAGDKQFYHPQLLSLWDGTVPILDKRKTDYYFDSPEQRSCVTTIDLPPGFEVETLPINQSLKFTYGSYDITYVYDAGKNQVTSTARFKITDQVIPAAKYAEMQQYLDAVAKAQNKKLVIRHKA